MAEEIVFSKEAAAFRKAYHAVKNTDGFSLARVVGLKTPLYFKAWNIIDAKVRKRVDEKMLGMFLQDPAFGPAYQNALASTQEQRA